MYRIKSCFRSLQGEGAQAGRVGVFVRMAGCNLWDGTAEGRSRAVCKFCDTDFVGIDGDGGGRFGHSGHLVEHICQVWCEGLSEGGDVDRFVIFTGGEPLLQLDVELVRACHDAGFQVAVETNGTLACPAQVDWICVSPKAGASLVQKSGDELKVVYPQRGIDLKSLETLDFRVFSIMPCDPLCPGDTAQHEHNTRACIAFCLANPKWRLRVQTHKWLGIA